jgi:hypothetical protein
MLRNIGRLSLLMYVPLLLIAQRTGPTLKSLFSFDCSGPSYPLAGVAVGSGGVLYGTTRNGGSSACDYNTYLYGCGAVYSLKPPVAQGQPWTVQYLYEFTGNADGAWPVGNIAVGSDGVLYGTTLVAGEGNGTVFSLTPPTSGDSWTFNTIYSFPGGSSGAAPWAGVVIGKGGVLYGTTSTGPVYSLTPPASPGGAWTETVLSGNSPPGSAPLSPVVIGGDGRLYGTSKAGGTSPKNGLVFSVPEAGGGENVVYDFTGSPNGSLPGPVTRSSEGVLYGTTMLGGNGGCPAVDGCGIVFSLTPQSGVWTEQILYSFSHKSGGWDPGGGVTIGGEGVLYGAAQFGGKQACDEGCGTLFSLKPPASSGGEWTYQVLHLFDGTDGGSPNGSLVRLGEHLLFGTTYIGGAYGCGTVFGLEF